MKISRRKFISRTAILCTAGSSLIASATVSPHLVNVVELGADPIGINDSANAIQNAINQISKTGGTVYFPAGIYRISKTIEWINPSNQRASGILFLGDGTHSTILKSECKTGPLFRIRGTPIKGPVETNFFWGGGIQQLTFDGSRGGHQNHDGIEIMGWWYGEISQVRILNFSRHGIRAITDLTVNPSPDFSASILAIKATWMERCGGWGFIDDGGVQCSPGWTWTQCMFVFCGAGGAFVQSSSHAFVKCSFSACGWVDEHSKPSALGYGLFFDGALTSSSRQWVEGCEFDTNYAAHIGVRFASSSSFINNRFIFNDRYHAGHLCPPIGVEIGAGDAKSAVRSVEFRQSFFRLDTPGKATGFQITNATYVRDISIVNSIYSDNTLGKVSFSRYKGFEAKGSRSINNYVIEDATQN